MNVFRGAENAEVGAEAGISLPGGVGLGLFPAGRRAGAPEVEAVEAGGGEMAGLATVEAGVEVVEVAEEDVPALDTGRVSVEGVEADTVVVPDAVGAIVEVVAVDVDDAVVLETGGFGVVVVEADGDVVEVEAEVVLVESACECFFFFFARFFFLFSLPDFSSSSSPPHDEPIEPASLALRFLFAFLFRLALPFGSLRALTALPSLGKLLASAARPPLVDAPSRSSTLARSPTLRDPATSDPRRSLVDTVN